LLQAYGDEIRFHLRSDNTQGAVTAFVDQTPPGSGPPPHFHTREEEWFFVLEGEAEFLNESEWTAVPAGTSVFMPRNSLHAFRNRGSGPLRQIVHTSPSGFENFMSQSAHEFNHPGGPTPARLLDIAARHNIYFPGLDPACAELRGPQTLPGIILPLREAQHRELFGERISILLDGVKTGGLFTSFLELTQPGGGPPPHYLARHDEWFYILEGNLQFLCGEVWKTAGPGTALYAPRGTVHTFRNTGNNPAKMLVHTAPSGIETFFDAAHNAFAQPGGITPQAAMKLASSHGVHFIQARPEPPL
jgi:mannose-6-phosphate isomerase-like protein (cupin superfamily)